jgi:hypothetical protein
MTTDGPYVTRAGHDGHTAYAELHTSERVPLWLIDYAGNVGQCRFFTDGRHLPTPDPFFMFAVLSNDKEPEWLCLKCLSDLYKQVNLRQMWRQP